MAEKAVCTTVDVDPASFSWTPSTSVMRLGSSKDQCATSHGRDSAQHLRD